MASAEVSAEQRFVLEPMAVDIVRRLCRDRGITASRLITRALQTEELIYTRWRDEHAKVCLTQDDRTFREVVLPFMVGKDNG
jgi:hypothetical protein